MIILQRFFHSIFTVSQIQGFFKRLTYLAQPWKQAREVIANLTSPPSGQGSTLLPEETLCQPCRGREINHAKIKLYQLVSKRMHLV